MALFGLFGSKNNAEKQAQAPQMVGVHAETISFNDPRFLEYVRSGHTSVDQTLSNPTVFRCVSLIVSSIGMLPLALKQKKTRANVEDHPLFDVLDDKPNDWQTPAEFKQFMQFWLLMKGNAYARIVRSGSRVVALIPLVSDHVTVQQMDDWTLRYFYQPLKTGDRREIAPADMLHLRALSQDGVCGISVVEQARNAIELARAADLAAAKVFKTGVMAGGALKTDKQLSPMARDNIAQSLEQKYSGAENAQKWMVLEEGLDVVKFAASSVDAQQLETRKHQVEEIGRVFGVPRPFLGVDDTSWGSGIEQLRLMLQSGALAPWFTVWEQGIARACLSKSERKAMYVDFDERELLRGSMKDQAEYLAKASGSGGHMPWMTPDEVRDYVGLGPIDGGDKIVMPGQQNKGPVQ